MNLINKITLNDCDFIANGCAFLGSGGGGSSHINNLITKFIIKNNREIKVLNLDDLNDNDEFIIVPFSYMGSPIVSNEKFPNLSVFEKVINFIKNKYQKNILLITAEIGGGNGMAHLPIASKFNIPVLDADMLGRAFPSLNHISTNINVVPLKESYFIDYFGNISIINVNNFLDLEDKARDICVKAGSSAVIIPQILTIKEAKFGLIKNTLSLALNIGKKLSEKNSTANILNSLNSKILGSGIISNIEQEMKGGFSIGKVIIKNQNDIFEIFIKNEYLYIKKNDEILIKAPDIITILDEDSLIPILSEDLKYGTKVIIVSKRTDEIWYTERGLSLVSLDKLIN